MPQANEPVFTEKNIAFSNEVRNEAEVLFIAYNFAYKRKYIAVNFSRAMVKLVISNGLFATLSIATINLRRSAG